MTATDGDLRRLFRKNLPDAMWQAVETGLVSTGVPDDHYIFPNGASGWIEHKLTASNSVRVRADQVAWLERYDRMGGRAFVAVRKRDMLYIFSARGARHLMTGGMSAACDSGFLAFRSCSSRPAEWEWASVRVVLSS